MIGTCQSAPKFGSDSLLMKFGFSLTRLRGESTSWNTPFGRRRSCLMAL